VDPEIVVLYEVRNAVGEQLGDGAFSDEDAAMSLAEDQVAMVVKKVFYLGTSEVVGDFTV
jgi:hypothetical protein